MILRTKLEKCYKGWIRTGGRKMKKVLIMLFVLVFSASILNAEDKVAQKMSLWEKIRAKIEKVTPQKKPSVTTAVGGVRGAKSDGGKELYWKGEKVSPSVSEQELDKFKEALTMAEAGDLDKARELFEKFVTDYPDSVLKGDALLALKEMSSAQEESAAASPQGTAK
jgi:TolA-binding protein